jgi:hypothetical protein
MGKFTDIGGTEADTPSYRVKPTWLNDNYNLISELIEGSMVQSSQLAYEQVKSDSTNWTNTDYLGADIFTDSNGAKNTIDTGDSNAEYNPVADAYELTFDSWGSEKVLDNFNDGSVGDWTTSLTSDSGSSGSCVEFNETSFSGYLYGFVVVGDEQDRSSTTTATYDGTLDLEGKQIVVEFDFDVNDGDSYHSAYAEIKWGSTELWKVDTTSTGSGYKLKLSPTNSQGTEIEIYLDTGSGYVLQDTISIAPSNELNFKCYARVSSSSGTGSSDSFLKINNVFYYDYQYSASDTVETNTIINEVVPKSIVVYGKTEIPTDTSITVDISQDGGSTWSLTDQELNSYIDTSSFTTGDLALKFNLSSTDTDSTPKLYGYGISITEQSEES